MERDQAVWVTIGSVLPSAQNERHRVTDANELCVLAVHAHPDDEASKGAATFARYATEGIRTVVVTCTGGERGDILNPSIDPSEVEGRMPEVRRAEMAESVAILNLSAHYWLGFEDSGMPNWGTGLPAGCFGLAPLEEPVEVLTGILRAERPQVVVTYDEWGGYPHPDHVKTHQVSMAAIDAAADADAYPDAGEAHRVSKVYYHLGFHKERLETLHAAALDAGFDSPFGEWIKRTEQMPQKEITTQVECAAFFEVRKKALLAHRTQVDPAGFWFQVSEEIVGKHWPYEDYTLVRSDVETEIPETDLFAGLR